MSLKGFKVLSSGIFSTIQDQGRYGYKHLGITHSGAMDEYAYLWGQKLLGNKNHNALEIMVGLKLKATSSTVISVCGADLNFQINGESKALWQTHNIKKGDVLSFPKRFRGQRAYLGVKGAFLLEKTYESYATTLKENIAHKVQRNDILKFLPTAKINTRRVKKEFIPNYANTLTLRLLPSLQTDYFGQNEQKKFFNSDYKITMETNRMGAKLKGISISTRKRGMISEGITFGSVQIPKDGQPILLLKEHQTIGGYPKIGTVLGIDCFKFSQLAMGDTVRFEKISLKQSREKILKFYSKFL